MIRALAYLAVLLWSHATMAETFPALYDVSGVAADDVLNLREAPSADGALVGMLAPDQTDVEVNGVSDDGRWARVNANEQSGWASLRYLTRTKDYPFLPMAHLNCYGTEPFWSLDKPQTGPITLSVLGAEFETWQFVSAHKSTNRIDRFSVTARQADELAVLTLERRQCSDGMSDQVFGIAADFIRPGTEQNVHLSGCCSIQP